MKPKVIFMGTPEFAVPILEKLIELTDVVLVVTQPDKEVGRKKELKFSPIKELALKKHIEVFQPVSLKKEMDKILQTKVDLIVTCAYGQILPSEVLNHPKVASINVHASLLPSLRGGAPIHHAIIDGYTKTGITIMYMDEGMDSGDIIAQEETDILDTDTVGSLHDRLSKIGPGLLEKTLPSILDNTCLRIKQDISKVTFAKTIKREDEKIDFNRCGKDIINQIRGLNPFPLSYIILNGEECKVYEANFVEKENTKPYELFIDKKHFAISCLDGVIYLTKIKPFGKKMMNITDYLNGIHNDDNWRIL